MTGDKSDGYWTFLEEMYPSITYTSDDEFHKRHTRWLEHRSFIFSVALEKNGVKEADSSLTELPYYVELEIERLSRMRQEKIFNRRSKLIDVEDVFRQA